MRLGSRIRGTAGDEHSELKSGQNKAASAAIEAIQQGAGFQVCYNARFRI
jgi:hypothetical protein